MEMTCRLRGFQVGKKNDQLNNLSPLTGLVAIVDKRSHGWRRGLKIQRPASGAGDERKFRIPTRQIPKGW
jgi:hypothetical protein